VQSNIQAPLDFLSKKVERRIENGIVEKNQKIYLKTLTIILIIL